MNLTVCSTLPAGAMSGEWRRAVRRHRLATPLATAHTVRFPTRFNAGPGTVASFETLYLAGNERVALWEVYALIGDPHAGHLQKPLARRGWRILTVTVTLQQVVDLTDPAVQRLLETSAQELTGDWKGYYYRTAVDPVPHPVGRAPTQELGQALYDSSRFEGLLTLSAKVPEQQILVVFPHRLQPGSVIAARLSKHDRTLARQALAAAPPGTVLGPLRLGG